MLAKIALLFLACSTVMQIHTGAPATQWPIRVHDSRVLTYYNYAGYKRTRKSDAIYCVQPYVQAPFTKHRLHELCRMSHERNLPWCFLVASIKQNNKPTRTVIYDTVAVYSLMYMYDWLPKTEQQSFLPQATKFLAAQCQLKERYIRLRIFNHYPNGRTTFITPGQGDRAALQASFTRNLLYGCHDEPTLRRLAECYNIRYITRLKPPCDELCTAHELAGIHADAKFWVERYLQAVPGNVKAQAALFRLLTDSGTTLYQ